MQLWQMIDVMQEKELHNRTPLEELTEDQMQTDGGGAGGAGGGAVELQAYSDNDEAGDG